jgi:hypothetical protein
MTISSDGILIDGYEISETGAPIEVDVAIPGGAGQVDIQYNSSDLGFGDALFF